LGVSGRTLEERIRSIDIIPIESLKSEAIDLGEKSLLSRSRLELITDMDESVKNMCKRAFGNGGHRIYPGIKGVGKSFLFNKMAIALSSFPHLLVVYVRYKSAEETPAKIVERAMQTRGIISPKIQLETRESLPSLLGELKNRDINLIFFADEVQLLFDDPDKFKTILEQLNELTEREDARLFITGSAQSLASRAMEGGNGNVYLCCSDLMTGSSGTKTTLKFNNTKVQARRVLPLLEREEFLDYYVNILGLPKPSEEDLKKKFLLTGGVPRYFNEENRRYDKFPEANERVTIVLHAIYNQNRPEFNLFQQKTIKLTDLNIYQTDDSRITAANLVTWADEGYLLQQGEVHNPSYGFISPEHYSLLESSEKNDMSFKEMAAIHHPVIGEPWEFFVAEGLATLNNFTFDREKPYLVFTALRQSTVITKDNAEFLNDIQYHSITKVLQKHIFKPWPDRYGFGSCTKLFNFLTNLQYRSSSLFV
jgi:hypothetical protein